LFINKNKQKQKLLVLPECFAGARNSFLGRMFVTPGVDT